MKPKYVYFFSFLVSLCSLIETNNRSKDLFVYMTPWVLEAIIN